MLLIVNHRQRQAAKAQIHRAFHLVSCLHRRTRLHIIRRTEHSHTGDGAHQRKVLAALVAGAVLADGNAAVRRADLHIQVRIADGIADLLKGASRHKHRKAGNERHKAHRRHARRRSDHVRLRDAAVKVPVREFLLERARHRGFREVRIQHDKILVLTADFYQRSAVARACCNLHFTHGPPPVPPSACAVRLSL